MEHQEIALRLTEAAIMVLPPPGGKRPNWKRTAGQYARFYGQMLQEVEKEFKNRRKPLKVYV